MNTPCPPRCPCNLCRGTTLFAGKLDQARAIVVSAAAEKRLSVLKAGFAGRVLVRPKDDSQVGAPHLPGVFGASKLAQICIDIALEDQEDGVDIVAAAEKRYQDELDAVTENKLLLPDGRIAVGGFGLFAPAQITNPGAFEAAAELEANTLLSVDVRAILAQSAAAQAEVTSLDWRRVSDFVSQTSPDASTGVLDAYAIDLVGAIDPAHLSTEGKRAIGLIPANFDTTSDGATSIEQEEEPLDGELAVPAEVTTDANGHVIVQCPDCTMDGMVIPLGDDHFECLTCSKKMLVRLSLNDLVAPGSVAPQKSYTGGIKRKGWEPK